MNRNLGHKWGIDQWMAFSYFFLKRADCITLMFGYRKPLRVDNIQQQITSFSTIFYCIFVKPNYGDYIEKREDGVSHRCQAPTVSSGAPFIEIQHPGAAGLLNP